MINCSQVREEVWGMPGPCEPPRIRGRCRATGVLVLKWPHLFQAGGGTRSRVSVNS